MKSSIAIASQPEVDERTLFYDYPFAKVHLATFCAKGSREPHLVFGWVELVPRGFPQPRSVAPVSKSIRAPHEGLLFHSRIVMTGERAIRWYVDAIRGSLVTPDAIEEGFSDLAGIPVSSRFVGQDPIWPRLGLFTGSQANDQLNYDLPFLPDWIEQPRIHRMSASSDAPVKTVVTRPEDAAWLSDRLWIDFALHPEWLGALALIAPNPLWSEMHHRKLPASNIAGERSLLRFVPRPGADLTGLETIAYERTLGTIGLISRGRVGPAAAVLFQHEKRPGALGVIVHDQTRGILHVDPPTHFLETIRITTSIASDVREMTAPANASPSSSQESFSVVDYSDSETVLGEGSCYNDVAVLAAAQRGRRNAADALGQRWFNGNAPTAAAFIRSLVRQARRKVQIYDPYVTGLELFRFLQAVSRRTVAVRAMTSSLPFKAKSPVERDRLISELAREELRLKEYRRGASTVEISILKGDPPPLHDRFLVVDDEIWFTGNSLGTLGERAGMMIRLPDPVPVMAELERLFANAEPVDLFLKRMKSNITAEDASS